MRSTDVRPTGLVTAEMREQYESEGYFTLNGVLSSDELQLLRGGAQYAMEKLDAEMDAAGVDRLRLNARGRRYFANDVPAEVPELRGFLFGETMANICGATLGADAYLFCEQYVIKVADPNTAFGWHQDSGYVHEDHAPYLTCWIALDDVTEANGPVYLLPYSQSGIRSYVKHITDPEVNDKVGYFGSDPGVPMTCPAGTIVCFSSVVMHRSGPNLTDRMRRVYVAQYSREVIMNKAGSEPHGLFERFLDNGEVVAAI